MISVHSRCLQSDPSYKFNYAVNDPVTGDNKGQWEVRQGDVVHGAYSLVEPDGNVRIVEYTADPLRGFNAVVKRTGPSVHSVALPVLKPITPILTKAVAAPIIHETIAPIAPIAPIVHGPILDHGAIGHGLIGHGAFGHGAIGHGAIGHGAIGHGAIIDHGPIVHAPVIQPVVETAPFIAPLPAIDILPLAHLPSLGPWAHLSGASYGPKGNIVRRWAAGPIAMEGKTLTVRSKH